MERLHGATAAVEIYQRVGIHFGRKAAREVSVNGCDRSVIEKRERERHFSSMEQINKRLNAALT